MKHLLDTDTLNYVLKAIPPANERFLQTNAGGSEFVLCPVVHYQVVRYLKLKGAIRMLRAYARVTAAWTPVQIEAADWDTAADLWAQRFRAGRGIEDTDLLIAVTALKTGAILVTNNTRHFEGLGLTLENWTLPEEE